MRQRNVLQRPDQFIRGGCTASEEVGRCVYISAPRSGYIYPVRLADPLDQDKIPAVGIVLRKQSPTECTVQIFGFVYHVFTGLERGKTYTVATGGLLARNTPDPPGGGRSWVQFMGIAMDSDVFYLDPEFRLGVRRGD